MKGQSEPNRQTRYLNENFIMINKISVEREREREAGREARRQGGREAGRHT